MKNSIMGLLSVLLYSCIFVIASPILSSAKAFDSITPLQNVSVSATTGEKPQSKVWSYDSRWWTVLADSSGTVLRRLDGDSWTNVLTLSSATNTHADVKVAGNVAHILLYSGTNSELVSAEYVPATHSYQLWTVRPSSVSITLDSGVETATIDVDSTGRMWLASDAATDINVRWSDSPYSTWSAPVTLGSGVSTDDICIVTRLNGSVGVLWSNQNTKRFGFKTHTDGTDPNTWSADEVPASQSAQNVGAGMADDHLNVAVASNGTLYAAVKTSYDTSGYAKIALLVRRPAGTWDDLYYVDDTGTRSIALLNEIQESITVVYTSSEGLNNIVYKQSALSPISFGGRQMLMSGSLNDVTSTKQNYTDSVVILASNGSIASGVLAEVTLTDSNLVGHWQMEENGGTTLVDSSIYDNNGIIYGAPAWITGVDGLALNLNGSTDYALIPDSNSLDITNQVTIAAWAKPKKRATQYLVKKAVIDANDGYELSLASSSSPAAPNKAFARFNQKTSGNIYRLNSQTDYPIDGNTWVHLAVTYDGSIMRLYYNGVEEDSNAASITIAANDLPVGIGAQSNGTVMYEGQIDDVRIYNRALTPDEILTLAQAPVPNSTDLSITKDDGKTEALPGDPVTYTIVVTNNGPNDVTGANVTDSLPANVTGISWTTATTGGANSTLGSGTGNINDTVDMPSGSTITYTVNAAFASGAVGVVSNTATVTAPSGTTDTNPANNSDTDTTTMISSADPNLVAFYEMEENGGTTLVDSSTYLHNGTLFGSPAWVTGVNGLALSLNGSTQYATVPDDPGLDITKKITIMAWVKPEKTATQYLVKKAVMGSTDGYELSLSSAGKAFVRFNQKTSADTYRVNSVTSYPATGTTWVHLAATYDGSNIRLYVNGIEDGTPKAAAIDIVANSSAMGIGAQSDAVSKFQGKMDDVRVYNRALSVSEIRPAVPNVVNTMQAAAQTSIIQAGLRIGNVTTADSNTIPAGEVISQTPAAGTLVIIGTPVNLVISLGPKQYTISGTLTAGSAPLKDVAMIGLPGNPLTDVNGFYSADVNDGSTITVTPAKTGYAFDPNSRTYTNVISDQLIQDYTGTLLTYTISGTVTADGTPLKDVAINGLPGDPCTDDSGYYSASVSYGWSGTVMPSKYAYAFSPNSKPYSNVTSDQNEQNYTAILLSYVISGCILDPGNNPVDNVSVYSTNGGGLDTTDPNGYYEIPVPYNWSGTITPAKAKYTFNPVDKQFTDILADQTDQNYVGTSIYDLDPDGIIDWGDLAVMSDNWLKTDEGISGDFNNDGIVNFLDFAEFAQIWQDQ